MAESATARGGFALHLNRRLFYGWVMLAVGALAIFASGPGQSFIFSVFVTTLSEDLALSRTAVSSAYATATLIAAFGLPYVGRLIDRLGPRRVMAGVGLLLGLACLGFSRVQGLLSLSLAFAALRFLGQGSLMLTANNLVAQWFSRRRGLAMSLLGVGFSLGMAVFPPLAQWLGELGGWRGAWLWLGVITWLLVIPAALTLIHDRPEDLRLRPDGEAGDAGQRADAAAELGLSLKQAMRTPAFWIIGLAIATLSMLVTGLFFHQIAIFDDRGLDPAVVAVVFPVSAVSMVVGMPLFGHLLDRLPTRPVFAAALGLMTLAHLAMVAVHELATAVLFGVVFGLSNAGIQSNLSYIWPRFFGRKYLGSIQGAAHMMGVLGASLGPLPLGAAHDYLGSYRLTLLGLAVLPIVWTLLLVFAPPPRLEDATRSH